MKKVKKELDVITCRDESKAQRRMTIFYKAREGYPAYHIFDSRRIQEQFFGVTALLDAYRLFGAKKYWNYAVKTLDCALRHYQKEDGRIETEGSDYSTVCCLMIPVADMAVFCKGKDENRAAYYRESAKRLAEYVYRRNFRFPTETYAQDFAEPLVEEGSMSCSALTLLYYCEKIERVDEYIRRAKEILDMHDCWVTKTQHACMYHSTLRWWETKWEGDKDGNALCCGHGWTIWRAEADYRYYLLTGEKEYFEKAKNGFFSNFSKIDRRGRSYACYQPDFITGGGFTKRGEDVTFAIAHGFPRQADSGLSRYVWIRYAEGLPVEF